VSPSNRQSSAPTAERFPLPACRERWLELLELEHATLAAPVDYAREGEELLVWREPIAAASISEGRVPRPLRPLLFLQAASAAAFFAANGFPLTEEDLEQAAWEVSAGVSRLWLLRSPSAVRREAPPTPVARALAALLRRLHGNRITHPPTRMLFERLTAPEAERRRAEFWVASAFRTFPELGAPAAALARQRCLGFSGGALRTPHARALAEKARVFLSDSEPRLFPPGDSLLTPGSALGLDSPPSDIADACRQLRERGVRESSGRRAVWVAVEPERWDLLSRRAFDAARLALGDRIHVVVVPERLPAPGAPDEWRRALWVPCGTVAGSVRFYEWFAEFAQADPARARLLAGDVLALTSWAAYAADPTGDAPLPAGPAAPKLNGTKPSRRVTGRGSAAAEEPGRRIELLVSDGRGELALREARRWMDALPGIGVEAWFPLAAFLSAKLGGIFAPWLEAIEAEREISGGRPAEARERLARIVRAAESSQDEKRRAKLRLAELAAVLGRPVEAARRAALWRREHPDSPAVEAVRALRLGATGLAREGRADCALALLEEAERLGADLSIPERLETELSRARVHALSGHFEEEDAIYERARPVALGSKDDRIASRFLAQEARGLLDRREYGRAIVRLEEALTISQDHPGERAELLLDLAATRYHAGDSQASEQLLEESLAAAAAAGREDLARIARGNRVELLINRCAWDAAAAELASLESSAGEEYDPTRRLVVLHHRSRLALRRGFFAAAARDNAEARRLAEDLADRLEIGELWLEEGDRCLYEGDLDRARKAWEAAAADRPDRCDSDRVARQRLDELAWRDLGSRPAHADVALEALFAADGYRAAETVARWVRILGEEAVSPDTRSRAERLMRASGGEALADAIFDGKTSAVPGDALREVRRAVSAALAGEALDGNEALASLGIVGLAIRDAEGREIVRLGGGPAPPVELLERPLEAGTARFELALWPPIVEERAATIGLVLETLLYRMPAGAPASDFEEGWRRFGVVTNDASMEEPFRRLVRFAPQTVTVLVLGESGSGKEAVARAIHRLSPRSSGPFVPVNLPSIPAALIESELFGHARGAFTGADRERRGLLEEAEGGTIFFDEIGDLAPPLQAKLLRSLQEREIRRVGENRARSVDVRVVSATSRDLAKEVEAGRFREDLYYRLHVAVIRLPALRERGRDGVLLARHFLERYAREYRRGQLRLTPEAAAAIASFPWPGNVRELQNAMAHAAALSDADGAVTSALLPETIRNARKPDQPPGDYRSRVDAHRRDLIADALDKAGGNRSRAARDLGLSRQALLYLIRELKVRDGRSRA
jgi:DNA-binding NtrC family response regulator